MRLTKYGKGFIAEALLVRLHYGCGPKQGERYYSEEVVPASILLRDLKLKPAELVRAAVAASEVLTYDSSMYNDLTAPMVFPALYPYLTWCGDFEYAESVHVEIVAENARRLARGERPILRDDDNTHGGDDSLPSNVVDFAKYKRVFEEHRAAGGAA